MCRFLLVQSAEVLNPSELLGTFAHVCRASRSRDDAARVDAWQGDGWGVAWLAPDGAWVVRKSLRPIWEEAGEFGAIPAARAFAVHARSASFERDRNDLEFNQPYLGGHCAFVFNGLLRGVSMPRRVAVEGRIGAQRIWNLLRTEMAADGSVSGAEGGPADALARVTRELEAHTRQVLACNVGLIDARHIYAVSRFAGNPGYYQLRWHAGAGLRLVCSEPLPGFEFKPVPADGVLAL